MKRKTPLVLVKPKAEGPPTLQGGTSKTADGPRAADAQATTTASESAGAPAGAGAKATSATTTSQPVAPAGLSLLSAYSDSSEDSNWPLHLRSIYIKSMFIYKLIKLYAKTQINCPYFHFNIYLSRFLHTCVAWIILVLQSFEAFHKGVKKTHVIKAWTIAYIFGSTSGKWRIVIQLSLKR